MWISKKEYEYLKSNQKPIHYDSEKLSEFFERQTLRQENGLLKKKTQEYINQHELDQMTIRRRQEIIFDLDKKLTLVSAQRDIEKAAANVLEKRLKEMEEKNKRKTPFARCPVCSSERPRKEFYNMQKNQIEYRCECGTEWAILGK